MKTMQNISKIGLGCMTLVQNTTEREDIAIVRAAVDADVTFLNTGDFYGGGMSEMAVGQFGGLHKIQDGLNSLSHLRHQ